MKNIVPLTFVPFDKQPVRVVVMDVVQYIYTCVISATAPKLQMDEYVCNFV
jgi:hypothetical protein